MDSETKKNTNHSILPVIKQNYRRWFLHFIRSGHIALIILLAYTSVPGQPRPFITTWKTDNPGISQNNQILIPGQGTNYKISWAVGGSAITSITGNGSTTVTFSSPGTYTVSITSDNGSFDGIRFGNSYDISKILSIDQWGDIQWSSMEEAFYGCANLINNATDFPDLTQVTSIRRMFREAPNYNGDLGNCNTSSVTNMSEAFWACLSFNQNIGAWNTENVTNMSGMFAGAINFNQDLSGWNTENVTDMSQMFAVSWAFDQDLSNWNTSSVTDMSHMFREAISFNQKTGNWTLNPTVNMFDMFYYSGIDCDNYSHTLMDWAANPNIPLNRNLGNANPLKFGTVAQQARNILTNNKGWIIGGDALDPGCQVSSLANSGFEKMRIYPNPTSDRIFFDQIESADYFLHDAVGRILKTGRADKGWIDMSDQPNGTYYISIISGVNVTVHCFIKM